MMATTTYMDEIIVDNFAGGGGASTGIELAAGRPVTIAINHDPAAILMHKTNHPNTLHMQEDVWNIDPKKVCAGRPVGLAWFSPDCKHFSKAKGGAPVEKNILENVEEFKTWGPVRRGKPIKSKQGQTFEKWFAQLKALGYNIESRELIAADYGAPTTRKRFVLIARCDGKPIVWPEKTHAPADSEEVKVGKCKPWRAAAEIIDWSLPCPSIFEDKATIKEKHGLTVRRPLKDKTLRRITRGIDKFVIKSSNPFIIPFGVNVNHGGKERFWDISNPLNTITAKHGYGITKAHIAPLHMQNNTGASGADMRSPVHTITTGYHQMLIVPSLSKYFGGVVGSEIDKPLPTVTSIDHNAVLSPYLKQYSPEGLEKETTKHTLAHIAEFKGQDKGQPVNKPLRTITTSAGEFGTVHTTITKISDNIDLHYWPQVRELLNKYCEYSLADDEILLLWVDGVAYFISDIGLRMLTAKELYKAQGFPDDYIIDKDYLGNEYIKTEQVARAGNAVCPPMATALVRANFPEWYNYTITTMAQLNNIIAVQTA